jgi:hypothetical protein
MFAKIGPCTKRKARDPRVRVLLEDLRAGDVARHQIGRELDAPEVEPHRLGHRADHQRLRETRHADEQRVPTREDRHQDLLEYLLLPHTRRPTSSRSRAAEANNASRRSSSTAEPPRAGSGALTERDGAGGW